jgi:hypothetical protein
MVISRTNPSRERDYFDGLEFDVFFYSAKSGQIERCPVRLSTGSIG